MAYSGDAKRPMADEELVEVAAAFFLLLLAGSSEREGERTSARNDVVEVDVDVSGQADAISAACFYSSANGEIDRNRERLCCWRLVPWCLGL